MQIVGIAKTLHPVAEEEIAALQAITIAGLQTEPRSYLNVGDKVRIEIGPLAGIEGILLKVKGAHQGGTMEHDALFKRLLKRPTIFKGLFDAIINRIY
jgi:transcription antitermination factor NusG